MCVSSTQNRLKVVRGDKGKQILTETL